MCGYVYACLCVRVCVCVLEGGYVCAFKHVRTNERTRCDVRFRKIACMRV